MLDSALLAMVNLQKNLFQVPPPTFLPILPTSLPSTYCPTFALSCCSPATPSPPCRPVASLGRVYPTSPRALSAIVPSPYAPTTPCPELSGERVPGGASAKEDGRGRQEQGGQGGRQGSQRV
eukprot:3158907-Rhodomonas_salina.1